MASLDTGAVTVDPAVLTFNPGDFDQLQAVTVTPIHDDDAIPESTTVTLSSPGVTARNITVGVADDDQQAIVIDRMTLALGEGERGWSTSRWRSTPAARSG